MNLDSVFVHKQARKELGQNPAIFTSDLANNPCTVYWKQLPSYHAGTLKIMTRGILELGTDTELTHRNLQYLKLKILGHQVRKDPFLKISDKWLLLNDQSKKPSLLAPPPRWEHGLLREGGWGWGVISVCILSWSHSLCICDFLFFSDVFFWCVFWGE